MTSERDRQRFVLALASPDPAVALHELAKALKAEGMGQVAMYHLFAELQAVDRSLKEGHFRSLGGGQ